MRLEIIPDLLCQRRIRAFSFSLTHFTTGDSVCDNDMPAPTT
jgi:hypothetical protein